MDKANTILLFGMPRSGTTWIGKIFDSHETTLYRHEPDTRKKINKISLMESVDKGESYCDYLNQYIDEFITDRNASVNGKLPLFPKKFSSTIQFRSFYYSILLSGAFSKLIKGMKFPVLHQANLHKRSEYVLVWKSIQLLGRMGIIVNCIDNCKAIHILRHPCGNIASVLSGERQKKFVSSTPASEDWELFEILVGTQQAERYGLSLDKLKSMEPEERLAWRWVLFNEKAKDDTTHNPNVRILRYEDMCRDPLQTAQDYFSFCGLGWSEQTASFLGASTSKTSQSYYSVYKNPEVAANKWREQLNPEQIKLIEGVVKKTSIGKYYLDDF
ncbi:MAG: sulfotransferase domain-containing protein [Sedimenticola sp.]